MNSSHHILKKGNQREVIPVQGKEIKVGLLNAILKRTELE
ncbi:type II toxin-antitoxin system HicA family toxin [Fundicoccus sp. Sow4_H7]